MAAAANPRPAPMTVEEFFAWDGGGHVGKLELIDGVVRGMAPPSATHSLIQANIARLIGNHLRANKSPCRVGTEAGVIPPMGSRNNARVPDLAVTCSPKLDSLTFEDPILIVEIISPSNEDESWESVRAVALLSSVKEVLVVQSTEVRAELFRRLPNGDWPLEPLKYSTGESLRLETIGLQLPVAEVYEGTHLA